MLISHAISFALKQTELWQRTNFEHLKWKRKTNWVFSLHTWDFPDKMAYPEELISVIQDLDIAMILQVQKKQQINMNKSWNCNLWVKNHNLYDVCSATKGCIPEGCHSISVL